MRTKTLLIAAAALAAGVMTSQAQVYSQNIVGYVNTTLPNGYTLLVAPVSPNPTNDAQSILPCLQNGDTLFVWVSGGYQISTYYSGVWYDGISGAVVPVPTLNPGAGFFYENNSGQPETNTFVGSVQLTNSISLANGYTLVGSTPPISTTLDNTTNISLPLINGDTVFVWNGGGYNISTIYAGIWYDGISGAVVPSPTVGVGSGFFYENNSGAAEAWNQNLIVQ